MHVDFVPTPYFARNPNLLRTRGSYEALRDDDNAVNTVWPARPNPGTNRAYQTGIDRPDGSLAKFTSVCSPLIYRGDRLPKELYGNVFVAEPAANLVSRIILNDDGTTLRARKAYDQGEFLSSTDERFRPVFLSNAPDGTLYIVDMYRGVLQQRADITQYLRDYIIAHKLERPTGLGRIYRVVHDTTRRDTVSGLSKADAGAAGRDAVASERLVARHGAAAAGRARGQVDRAGTQEARRGEWGLADARARAVDARRHRRHRAGHSREGDRGSVARGAGGGNPHRRALAGRRRPAGPGRGVEPRWTTRTGRCGSSWPRRSARCRRGHGSVRWCRCSSATATTRSPRTRR